VPRCWHGDDQDPNKQYVTSAVQWSVVVLPLGLSEGKVTYQHK